MRTTLLVGLQFVLTAGQFVWAAKDLPQKPNIVLLMTDDQGFANLGAHGHPDLKTPNLDAFRRESLRFTDFLVEPTCSPTRAALMTGAHPFQSGVTHTIQERERMALDRTTVAEVLSGAGYRCGIFGKWHLGDEAPYRPDRRGFDEVFIHGAGGIGQTYPGSCGDFPGNRYFDPWILHNGMIEKTKGYCTDVFFNQAMRWIEAQAREGRPFFAYIPTNAPHAPYISPGKEYDRVYEGKGLGSQVVAFYSMIANIDENFGRLLRRLDELGLRDNTLVIAMTDNGAAQVGTRFTAGLKGCKGTVDYGGTRSFAFWRWPRGFDGGKDCDAFTAHIDLLPTFAELAGVSLSEKAFARVEGRSMVPLLLDPGAAWPDRVYFTHLGRWDRADVAAQEEPPAPWSIRTNRYLVGFGRRGGASVYDLKKDPGQRTNLADAHKELIEDLAVGHKEWWQAVKPRLVNEGAAAKTKGPNAFKALFYARFPEKKTP